MANNLFVTHCDESFFYIKFTLISTTTMKFHVTRYVTRGLRWRRDETKASNNQGNAYAYSHGLETFRDVDTEARTTKSYTKPRNGIWRSVFRFGVVLWVFGILL